MTVGEQMMTSGHQRTNYEVEVVSKGGRFLTLETSNKLITKGSQPIGIQGIARDISMRRRAEGGTARRRTSGLCSEYERLLERISGLAQRAGNGPRARPPFFVAFAISPESQFLATAFLFRFTIQSRTFELPVMHGATARSSRFLSYR